MKQKVYKQSQRSFDLAKQGVGNPLISEIYGFFYTWTITDVLDIIHNELTK